MSRAITLATLSLIPSWILLLLTCLSVPITRFISLGSLNGLHFGVFGYCFVKGKCNVARLGYRIDTAILSKSKHTSDFYFSFYKVQGLTYIFIVHIVAALLTFCAFVFTLIAHLDGPSKSGFFLVIILIITFFTVFLSIVSFIVDVLFFIPHIEWGTWCILGASILNIIVFGLIHLSRKYLIACRSEKVKTALSYHSQRRHPNLSYSYTNNLPYPKHTAYQTKKDGINRTEKEKSGLDSMKYSKNDNSDIKHASKLKKLELPPINTHLDDHNMLSKSFLDSTYCNSNAYDSTIPNQNVNITYNEAYKDDNGVHESYLKRKESVHERMGYPENYSKDYIRHHLREHPRNHSRYQSADIPRDPQKNHPREPLKDVSKDYQRSHARYHSSYVSRHHSREQSADAPGEYLRAPPKEYTRNPRDFSRDFPRDFPKEQLRNHSRGQIAMQPYFRQGSDNRNMQYPAYKPPVGLGIDYRRNPKRPNDLVEKEKPNNNYNNSYGDHAPPKQIWKDYPLPQNGRAFPQDSNDGVHNFSSCKQYVSDKPYENSFAEHGPVSRNYAYNSHPYSENAEHRFPNNTDCSSHTTDQYSRMHHPYHSSNCTQTQESLSPRFKSPASTSSEFTSISQRGINPKWVPPSKEQIPKPGKFKHNNLDATLVNNLNYDPVKNPYKEMGVVGSAGT
ncbi:hypothetical protein T552_00788 [Pneumocystis carinii B80]|uniref:PH-response regulator protein palI/RIM9 n=1 Tax=Pneumocystis carinii (strain B80) TaxID=1408658 RepID=A0A0W4ZPL0_PNEC8|nr:hypothetical protein T552_00788 [Pneumocystis carinii B80]KTW30314.1 hypothetical protein T552_00788 [Pneumocystis carinii B80]